jgi:hypothetical protein
MEDDDFHLRKRDPVTGEPTYTDALLAVFLNRPDQPSPGMNKVTNTFSRQDAWNVDVSRGRGSQWECQNQPTSMRFSPTIAILENETDFGKRFRIDCEGEFAPFTMLDHALRMTH